MFIYSTAHITLGQYLLPERFISHVQYEVLPKYASGFSLTGCNSCNLSFETPVNFIIFVQAYCSNLNIAAASRSSAWRQRQRHATVLLSLDKVCSGLRLALATLRDAAKPDLVSFNSAVAACARATKWPQALRLLGNLRAAALHADQRTWTPLLPVLPWPRALQVLGDLEERSLLDPPLLAAALAATARAHAWVATLQLLNQLRARDEGGRGFGFAVGLSAAIRSLAKASRWPVSLGLVQESRDMGRLQHDVVLLSTCLLACRAGALWQLGLCVLQAADGAELPNAAAHNSAISACAEESQWQTALWLLADAEHLGILDVTTCNASGLGWTLLLDCNMASRSIVQQGTARRYHNTRRPHCIGSDWL